MSEREPQVRLYNGVGCEHVLHLLHFLLALLRGGIVLPSDGKILEKLQRAHCGTWKTHSFAMKLSVGVSSSAFSLLLTGAISFGNDGDHLFNEQRLALTQMRWLLRDDLPSEVKHVLGADFILLCLRGDSNLKENNAKRHLPRFNK